MCCRCGAKCGCVVGVVLNVVPAQENVVVSLKSRSPSGDQAQVKLVSCNILITVPVSLAVLHPAVGRQLKVVNYIVCCLHYNLDISCTNV